MAEIGDHNGIGDKRESTQASNVAESKKNTGTRKRSWVWEHFTVNQGEGETSSTSKRRASCNYCGHDYACDPRLNGTSSMKTHLEVQCKKFPLKKVDNRQSTLGFKPREEGGSSAGLVAVQFNAESCRVALAEMLIMDELPFRFVEGEGFRKFMLLICPKWTKIPSRITIAKECQKVYLREKKKLKSVLKDQRICLTTDTWTSIQNLNYMCLTAHFIDSEWRMHKRILNFRIVENHKGDTLGKAVESCLLEWGIEKILTITVDNASSNNTMIQFLKRKTTDWPSTLLGHDFLHMRCCAHILNLIVRDGLKDMDASIARVRNAVRYVRSSPQRWKLFKQCADMVKVGCKAQVCLDVPTRWNYTYQMLDRAEKYKKAFERMEEEDVSFLSSLGEESCDGHGGDCEDVEGSSTSRRGRRMLGPPEKDDWEKVRLFAKFLEIFYDATLKFSGTKHVTCNSFFLELVAIQDTIDEMCHECQEHHGRDRDISLRTMAYNMKRKFEKYWGSFEDMNPMLYVGLVLDPRYKLMYVEFCLGSPNEQEKAKDVTKKVKDALVRLYDLYVEKDKGLLEQSKNKTSQVIEPSDSIGSGPKDVRALRKNKFKKLLEEANSIENKSEVEKYLAEACVEDVEGFDILNWWKTNASRFRVLSLVARHVLAIPVSTVASESCFSTAGRVLDPFRSSLAPKTVEALICAQNWLRSSAISLRDAMDDIEEFDKIEQDFVEESISFDALSAPTVGIGQLGRSEPSMITLE